jgi:hypothetical protein|nr:MAG TPA: outer membrane protein [Bacteriophage sp.]
MNNVYFGAEGLNSTSANYYANVAQEMIQSITESLNSIKLYKTCVSSIDSQSPEKIMSKGWKSLDSVKKNLEQISKMNAFCAWVREAIKEKDAQLISLKSLTLEKWIKDTGYGVPSTPEYPEYAVSVLEEDVINSWDINKRNKYLKLEAFASTYGKYIHPKGAFSKARKEMHNIENSPITKEGSGRDLILYYYYPTVDSKDVEKLFFELQEIYRSYEKELNAMKAEIQADVNRISMEREQEFRRKVDEYNKQYDEYNSAMRVARSDFNNWVTSERERISKLKIVLPSNLLDTFKEIQKQCDSSK